MAWLDTMVWSSAQRHNVDDMVDKCFGDRRIGLVAVWARDTLGLRPDEFRMSYRVIDSFSHDIDYFPPDRKTQTTKDLGKPWTALSLRPPTTPEHESGQTAVIQQSHTHSALTTVLLDDSPLKARLQPWNHICIPEYTRTMRLRDLDTNRSEKEKQLSLGKGEADVVEDELASSTSTGKKRKLKRKYRGSSEESESLPEQSSEPAAPADGYDQTLLAVIGVLEAVKDESNVAGWIRAGGLLGKPSDTSAEDASSAAGDDAEGSDVSKAGSPAPEAEESPGMWFENPATLEYWVSRGRDAISALGIAPEAGIKG